MTKSNDNNTNKDRTLRAYHAMTRALCDADNCEPQHRENVTIEELEATYNEYMRM